MVGYVSSYPYLNLSRALSVPYSDVLLIADMLDENGGPFDPVLVDKFLYTYVEEVWLREQARRRFVMLQLPVAVQKAPESGPPAQKPASAEE